MTRVTLIAICALGAALVSAFGYWYLSDNGSETPPSAMLPAFGLEEGAGLYARFCADCHGDNLEGQPNWQVAGNDGVLPAPPHDDSGHTWHHPDTMLFDYTKYGGQEMAERMGLDGVASGMPGFADVMTDEEIWTVLAFIKSRWSERNRQAQAQRSQ